MAGKELILFLVAGMGLFLGSVLKTVDNIGMFKLSLSRGYTEPRSFLLLTPPARVCKELGQDTARTIEKWDILY